jgi:DNA-binding CsgD family transcriptional regulator
VILSELVFSDACGWDFFQAIAARPGPPKIIAYADQETGIFFEAQYLGRVDGFVSRDMPAAEVEAQLLAACGTAPAFSPRQFEILRRLAIGDAEVQTLSARELTLVRHLVRLLSAKEIAAQLGISVSGVYKAKQRIMTVLGVTSLSELATMVRRLGLVPSVGESLARSAEAARASA